MPRWAWKAFWCLAMLRDFRVPLENASRNFICNLPFQFVQLTLTKTESLSNSLQSYTQGNGRRRKMSGKKIFKKNIFLVWFRAIEIFRILSRITWSQVHVVTEAQRIISMKDLPVQNGKNRASRPEQLFADSDWKIRDQSSLKIINFHKILHRLLYPFSEDFSRFQFHFPRAMGIFRGQIVIFYHLK